MSQENVEAVHRGVDAMNCGELDPILDLIDDSAVWEPLRASFEGAYRGHAGMRRFFADTAESFERFEVRFAEIRDLGDRVLAIGTVRARGRDSGAEIEIATAAVFTFREGRLVHYRDYGERLAALEAAGLQGRRATVSPRATRRRSSSGTPGEGGSRAATWSSWTPSSACPRTRRPRACVSCGDDGTTLESRGGASAACMAPPDTYEEAAWTSTRWRARRRTFAHVVRIERGWPQAYAGASPRTRRIRASTGPKSRSSSPRATA
jgi:ketosteroid isomerase-like protein